MSEIKLSLEEVGGQLFDLISFNNQDNQFFIIGVKLASFLQKQTYNLYRSLRKLGVCLKRADEETINRLKQLNVITKGTNSMTLIPFNDTTKYHIQEIMIKPKENRIVQVKPKIKKIRQIHKNIFQSTLHFETLPSYQTLLQSLQLK